MKKKQTKNKYWFPSVNLDLHGLNVEEAYKKTKLFLDDAKVKNLKYVGIITGKSGQIRYECPQWLDILGYKYQMSIHGGSFIVWI